MIFKTFNLEVSILSIIILFIILNRNLRTTHKEIIVVPFTKVLIAAILCSVIEFLWSLTLLGYLNFYPSQQLLFIFTSLLFICSCFVAYRYISFTEYFVDSDYNKDFNLKCIAALPLFVISLLILLNYPSRFLFTIDENLQYKPSSYSILIYLFENFYYIFSIIRIFVLFCRLKDKERKKQCIAVFIFNLIPLFGSLARLYNPYMPYYTLSFLLSELVIFLFILSKEREKLIREIIFKQDQEEIKRSTQIIDILSSDYTSVYYVNIDTGLVIPYRMNDRTKMFLGPKADGNTNINYSEQIKLYIDYGVSEEDRDFIQEFCSVENIRNTLKFSKSAQKSYVNDLGYYCEIKIVKVGTSENFSEIALGFANKDNEIRAQQRQNLFIEDARKKAEMANKAKSSFLFNMSHDIRTPMNAITGFTNMALKNLNNTEKITDCLKKIQTASDHLLKLINDVLDMSRIENGKTTINVYPSSIKDISDQIVSMTKQSAEAKNHTFNSYLYDIRNNYVFIDSLHINQVLINLIGNSIKYTPDGGKIDFSIRQVHCSENGYASFDFSVADNGIGMSDEFQSRLFGAFERERSSTVSGIEGTGLGLSITKNLVDLMGGIIDVQSVQGSGTTITIHITFKICEQELYKQETVVVKKPYSLKGKKVLLVEDNDLNREIAVDILQEEGLIVFEAKDGVDAVDIISKAEKDAYDFVLMDIQMPVMDGYAATQKIRSLEECPLQNIPIFALTANAFDDDRNKAEQAGMNGHITKPIKNDELFSTVNDYFNHVE